jgi:hypothetical protein
LLSDNQVSAAQSLPFIFNFYGIDCSSVYVSANGTVGFSAEGLGESSNQDLPAAAAPNAVLYPWWDALSPNKGGSVHVGAAGTAPDRRFVVSWVNVAHRNPGRKAAFTFQAVLEEASGRIVFQYLDVDASHNLGAGASATVGIENQTGTLAARYSHNGSSSLQNNQSIAFVPPSTPDLSATSVMSVAAAQEFVTIGPTGGPFVPEETAYLVGNTGSAPLAWQAAVSADWLSLSLESGTLSPGESIEVRITLNAQAHALPAGEYFPAVGFSNLDNGAGDTTRSVFLTVEGMGVLAVSPDEGFDAFGPLGGPFSPSTQDYTLSNTGDGLLDWSVSESADWLAFSVADGQLAPGESTVVTIALDPAADVLSVGTYEDTLVFADAVNDAGDIVRTATLTIEPGEGLLALVTNDSFRSSGFSGGSFTPMEKNYRLSNPGSSSVDWVATADQSWFSVSVASGTLGPGGETEVMISLTTLANELQPGVHTGQVTFSNPDVVDEIRIVTVELDVFKRPMLTWARLTDPKALLLTLTGESDQVYRLELTTDFRNWTPVHTNKLSADGMFEYTYPSESAIALSTFRAVWIP